MTVGRAESTVEGGSHRGAALAAWRRAGRSASIPAVDGGKREPAWHSRALNFPRPGSSAAGRSTAGPSAIPSLGGLMIPSSGNRLHETTDLFRQEPVGGWGARG